MNESNIGTHFNKKFKKKCEYNANIENFCFADNLSSNLSKCSKVCDLVNLFRAFSFFKDIHKSWAFYTKCKCGQITIFQNL